MGFSRLNANVWTWFGIAATLFVTVFVAIVAIGFGFISAMASALNSPPYDINVTTTIVLSGLTAALIGACGYLAFTVSLRGALAEVDGHKPTFGAFFRDIRWGSVLLSFPIVACFWILAVLPAIVLSACAFILATEGHVAASGLLFGTIVPVAWMCGIFAVSPMVNLITLTILENRTGTVGNISATWSLVNGHYWKVLGTMVLISLIRTTGFLLFFVGALYSYSGASVATADMPIAN